MSLAEKVRKADWLNELRALVIVGIVLTLLFSLIEVITVALGGQAVVEVRHNPAGPQEFQLGGQAVEHVSTRVAILEPTPAQALWYLGTFLPSAVVLLAALSMLLRLLSRARRANPFTRDTVRDLRWLAVVVLVGGTLASLVESVATLRLSAGLKPDTVSGYWNLPALWLLAGFGAMAVAEIVARGCALREELDEVV
ncbi:MAG TPA: DUF2975 domain-containing protein [Candidatus Limnocylindrales bacterium]|nr:DUF2975 domain-containing protein [Candidatus Limnocylindrales bacterium]